MLNKRNFPKFNPDSYTGITLNNLVVYAIYYLHQDDAEIVSEDIISACFKLFPKRFSLKKYPQWPDSAMVNRRWSDCRRKGYIAAKTDSGFKLTAKGLRLAEKVAKKLGVAIPHKVKPAPTKKALPVPVVTAPKVEQKAIPPAPIAKPQPRIMPTKKALPVPVVTAPKVEQKAIPPAPIAKPQPRITPTKKALPVPVVTAPKVEQKVIPPAPVIIPQEAKIRAGKFVRMMETSDAYRQYKKNGKNANIGEFDFRSLLLCTMESSPETLTRNVDLFKGYAEIHNRQDLIAFLTFCKDKFAHLLAPQKKMKSIGSKK
jgi:hypothetical protein